MPSLAGAAGPDVVPGVLVVPLGSVEQRGAHPPASTGTAVAGAVAAVATASLDGALLAPALTYGATVEQEDLPGTVPLGTEALTGLLVEYGRSASRWAARVLVVNGHDGNLDALRAAGTVLRREGRDVAWFPCSVAGGDAHAGRAEPSPMLQVEPLAGRLVAAAGVWRVDDAGRLDE